LFPQPLKPHLPFNNVRFNIWLNLWAKEQDVRGPNGKLWHFKSHQFRHKRALKWLIEDELDLPTIRLLLGHKSITMTEIYAAKKLNDLHRELLTKKRRRKVIDYQGHEVRTDPRTESTDALILRSVFRGASLPIGGCAKPITTGECAHLNKCFSCAYHVTTTDDLPLLREARCKVIRVLNKARAVSNEPVIQHNEQFLAGLDRRIEALEGPCGKSSCWKPRPA
jgi:integrase/recombinase XerD